MSIVWHELGPEPPVTDSVEHEQWEARFFLGVNWMDMACFLCAQPLEFPFVLWRGTEFLQLHPVCAEKLSVRLITDARIAMKPEAVRRQLQKA